MQCKLRHAIEGLYDFWNILSRPFSIRINIPAPLDPNHGVLFMPIDGGFLAFDRNNIPINGGFRALGVTDVLVGIAYTSLDRNLCVLFIPIDGGFRAFGELFELSVSRHGQILLRPEIKIRYFGMLSAHCPGLGAERHLNISGNFTDIFLQRLIVVMEELH